MGKGITKRQSGDGCREDASLDFWFAESLRSSGLACRDIKRTEAVPAGVEPRDRDLRWMGPFNWLRWAKDE